MNLINAEILGGLKSILGDEIFSITRLYADQLPADVAQVVATHALGNAAELKRLAHALKGGSANMGAVEMARLAANIERAAAAGNLNGVAADVSALTAAAEKTLTEMRAADLLRPPA